MYPVHGALIILAAYVLPALAVRPAMILRRREVVAIPFVAVVVILAFQTLLVLAGQYHVAMVRGLCLLISVVAVVRVALLLKTRQELAYRKQADWKSGDSAVAIISACFALFVGSLLILHGFDRDDEIYSWNMWAIQHFQGQSPDFYYTKAPYPQLFPKLLSFGYMLAGDIDAQAAVKGSLMVFPFFLFLAIGLALPDRRNIFLVGYVVLLVFVLVGLNLKGRFDEGMPDTLMTSAVVASVFLLLAFRESMVDRWLLLGAVICAIVGLLAKQPGLLWGAIALPLILSIDVFRNRASWRDLALACLPLLCALVWLFSEGRGFDSNSGVLTRSLDGRNLYEQIQFVAREVLADNIAIPLVIAFATFAVLRTGKGICVGVFFVIPSLAAWLVFASYDMRAGMPGLMTLCLLMAWSNFGATVSRVSWSHAGSLGMNKFQVTVSVALVLVVAAHFVREVAQKKEEFSGYRLGNHQLNNLYKYFGDDAPTVYASVRSRPDLKVWASSNYVYGMFFGHQAVLRPDYDVVGGYTPAALLAEIRRHKPDFMASSRSLDYGPGGEVLREVAQKFCPGLFEVLVGPDNPGEITIYRLDPTRIESDDCAVP